MGWGGVGAGEAGGGLNLPIGLFGVAMSPRSAGHRPRQDWRALLETSHQCRGEYHADPCMPPT